MIYSYRFHVLASFIFGSIRACLRSFGSVIQILKVFKMQV